MLLDSQYSSYHIIRVNYKVCQGFADGLMYCGVINPLHAFQTERALQVLDQSGLYGHKEVVQIVFPPSVVCQTVAPAALRLQVGHVEIIHTDVVEALSDWQPFAEHKQTS